MRKLSTLLVIFLVGLLALTGCRPSDQTPMPPGDIVSEKTTTPFTFTNAVYEKTRSFRNDGIMWVSFTNVSITVPEEMMNYVINVWVRAQNISVVINPEVHGPVLTGTINNAISPGKYHLVDNITVTVTDAAQKQTWENFLAQVEEFGRNKTK